MLAFRLIGGDDADITNEISLACLELGAKEVVEGNIDREVSSMFTYVPRTIMRANKKRVIKI